MKPLSQRKRSVYLVLLSILFIVCVPLFILYARGYRFDFSEAFQVSETGGLYINADQSGASIYVDGEIVRKTSIVQKSVFVQSLDPGVYQVSVSKDGFQTWNKTLKVFPEIVTEARSFSLKTEPILTEIPRNLPSGNDSTGTSSEVTIVKNPAYDSINALFISSQRIVRAGVATTTANTKTIRNILVKNDKGQLRVFWTGDADSIPNYFCESNVCKTEILISRTGVSSFDFLPGRDDLLIIRVESGIYVTEIDDRSPQNIQKIVLGTDYDFRVKDGSELYLKQGAKIYSVSL